MANRPLSSTALPGVRIGLPVQRQSLAGIAVAAAMLLDMVMLSGGIDQSFRELLLARGYQIRLTPKGTLPFDTEGAITGATGVVRALRAEPGIAAAGAVLGTSLYARVGDSLITLFGYGIQPEAQAIYQVMEGRDLAPDDVHGVLVSEAAARLLGPRIHVGDRVTLLEQTQGTDGSLWYQVRFASGAEGWVRGDFVQVASQN